MKPYEKNHEHKQNHKYKREHNSRAAVGSNGIGRSIQVWIPQDLEYRLQRYISENQLPSRSSVIETAIVKYLDNIETILEIKRRDQQELKEVPPLMSEELPE